MVAPPNGYRQVDSSSIAAEESGLYRKRRAPELEKDRPDTKRWIQGYKRNLGTRSRQLAWAWNRVLDTSRRGLADGI